MGIVFKIVWKRSLFEPNKKTPDLQNIMGNNIDIFVILCYWYNMLRDFFYYSESFLNYVLSIFSKYALCF